MGKLLILASVLTLTFILAAKAQEYRDSPDSEDSDDYNLGDFTAGRNIRLVGDFGKRQVNCRRLSNGGSRCVNANGSVYYLGSGPAPPPRK